MAEVSQAQRDILIRLRLDPTSQREGYQQAKQIQAQANAEMLAIDAQRQRARGELEGKYTSDFMQQAASRLSAVQHEMAVTTGMMQGKNAEEKAALMSSLTAERDKYAAIQAEVAAYAALRQSLTQMNLQYREQSALAKEARAAAMTLGPGAGAGFELQRVLSGVTPMAMMQAVGLGALAVSLPMALRSIGEGFVGAATDAGKFGHELDLISQKTGIPMQQLQQLGAIGKMTGMDLNDVVIATRRFAVAITGGAGGTGEEGIADASQKGARLLAALGIETKATATTFRSTSDVMLDVADVFHQIPDGAEKSAMAVALFGRSGLNMIPFLNLGREGMAAVQEQFAQFMPNMAGAADLYEKLEVAQAKWDISLMALKEHLASELLPTIIELTDNLAALAGIKAQGGSVLEQLLTGRTSVPGLENNLADQLKAMGSQVVPGRGAAEEFQRLVAVRSANLPHIATPPEGLEGTREGADLVAKWRAREDALKKISDAEYAITQKTGRDRKDMSDAEVAAQSVILQGLAKRVDAEKTVNDQLQQRMQLAQKVLAGDQSAKKEEEFQKRVDEAYAKIQEAVDKGQEALADARLKTLLPPLGAMATREAAAQSQLGALQEQAAGGGLTHDEMLANLAEQKRLEEEIYKIRLDRYELVQKEAAEMLKEVQQLDEEIGRSTREWIKNLTSDFEKGLGPLQQAAKQPPPPPGASKPLETLRGQFETATGQLAVGAISPQEELDKLKDINTALDQSIAAAYAKLAAETEGTDQYAKQVELLKQLLALQGKLTEETKKTAKETPAGEMMGLFHSIQDVIGTFGTQLRRQFSEIAAGVRVAEAGLDSLRALGGKKNEPGTVLDGLMKIFSSDSSKEQRIQGIQGALSFATGAIGTIAAIGQSTSVGGGILSGGMGGAMLGMEVGGPIGAVIGGVGGAIFGGISGAKRTESARLVKQVQDSFKDIGNAYNAGTVGLAQTITDLQSLRDKAVAGTRGGKKGNASQMQSEIDAIDSQMAQLKRQQKDILENFRAQIGIFAVPTGAQDTATAILNIAKALKQAADAGATAAEQVKYLNGAMDQLKTKTGDTLRTDAKDTLDLMTQSLDLAKQREDLETSYQDSVLNIKRQLGLAPALTPEQQAAKQLLDLKKSHDDQLQQIDSQQKLLQAQLDGRMQLFGWTQKDLDATSARTSILNAQLAIERQITAETIAQIQAQEDMFAQMASGKIPSLPAGVLPPGFSWPTGSTFSGPVTINLNLPNATGSPADLAKALQDALAQINKGRQIGLQ